MWLARSVCRRLQVSQGTVLSLLTSLCTISALVPGILRGERGAVIGHRGQELVLHVVFKDSDLHASELIWKLRRVFESYGVAKELTSDSATVFRISVLDVG